MMKIKFVDQQFQTDAVNAIVNIFEGTSIKESLFTIDVASAVQPQLDLKGQGSTYELGYSNRLDLDDFELLANVRKVQERNGILKSTDIQGRNFTIEMETGTGKTYVYTKTILELHKRYGMTKFIIVVPGIAIKEGVFKSFQITEDHFKLRYDNEVYDYFVYDSSKLDAIHSFATSTNIQVMIINIDAFRKSFDDPEKENKANIIHRASDKLSGNKPIDLIASTRPIVIIDEPQSVDNTTKAKDALQSLKPLFTLRYSATHRELYNLMYRLTPVDAYHQNLVKHIEVSALQSGKTNAAAYIKLISTSSEGGYSAKLEINKLRKDGTIEKATVVVKQGDDLWEKSNELDYYKENDYTVEDIEDFTGNEYIYFVGGVTVRKGEEIGGSNLNDIKRAQIRETIELHLTKELNYLSRGIKVLSLFFIDQVDKYRSYDGDTAVKGIYAKWFEEEYALLIAQSRFARMKDFFDGKVSFDPELVHDGYFSIDKKGRYKDTRGDTSDDESTYEKIMRDKEKLLSFSEPLRFIFSHSALKEGWDNPNVFQVCTLVETKDTMTKRQKIGRGLRICVDQDGERVNEPRYNKLSVVANESYYDFSTSLQKELEQEAGYKFGIIDKMSFSGISVRDSYGKEHEVSQEQSVEIHRHLLQEKYIKSNGKVEEQFFVDVANESFALPASLQLFTQRVIEKVEQLSRTIEIKNARERVKVELNKEVMLSESFQTMWNKIKRKTIYSVEMDIDAFKKDTIKSIKQMPKIEAEKIERDRSKINITQAGVVQEGPSSYGNITLTTDTVNTKYPDVLRRLQDATSLTRRTIIGVLSESKRFSEFYINPESFIRSVTGILNSAKRRFLIDGLRYHALEDFYVAENVFDATELYGYQDSNLLEIASSKNVFNHVIYDSSVEKQFAIEAESDDDVLMYAKLPSKFVVGTPFGNYNPDWMIVIKSEEGEKLYFVAETKGSENNEDLRASESNKIISGRKHFEIIDSELRYEVVSSLKTIKRSSNI
jgi:type III restriction enzyme